jgi:DNA-binding beta-propeller fold protein YncE
MKLILSIIIVILVIVLLILLYCQYKQSQTYENFDNVPSISFATKPLILNIDNNVPAYMYSSSLTSYNTESLYNSPQNTYLLSGQSLVSGNYKLLLNENGNLALYNSLDNANVNSVIWQSNTENKGVKPYVLILQSDGNLVIIDNQNQIIWSSNTKGQSPLKLVLSPNGNLCIVDNTGKSIWCQGVSV